MPWLILVFFRVNYRHRRRRHFRYLVMVRHYRINSPEILVEVFFKSETEAETLMLQVHHSDKAVVGIYSYDVATSKVHKATSMARDAGYPLRLTVEPEGRD